MSIEINETLTDKEKEVLNGNDFFNKTISISGSSANSYALSGDYNPIGFGNGFTVAHYDRPFGKECITFGNNGDTLCIFPMFSETSDLKPKGSAIPFPLKEMHYYYNEQYTFRYLYNDTVYKIQSPNIIHPVYVIDFGQHKLTPEAWIKQSEELQNCIILRDMCEDEKYLYLYFHKGYDNHKNSNEIKYWRGLYNKATGNFFVLPDNSYIINDIDGGMSFFPKSIDSQGRKMAFYRGKTIKKTLTAEYFENTKASNPNKKESLKQFVKTLSDDDMVIMVVK